MAIGLRYSRGHRPHHLHLLLGPATCMLDFPWHMHMAYMLVFDKAGVVMPAARPRKNMHHCLLVWPLWTGLLTVQQGADMHMEQR